MLQGLVENIGWAGELFLNSQVSLLKRLGIGTVEAGPPIFIYGKIFLLCNRVQIAVLQQGIYFFLP